MAFENHEGKLIIRKANEQDYQYAVSLYKELGGKLPVIDGDIGYLQWCRLLEHPGTTVFVTDDGGDVTSIATLHILPNMTNAGKPYALIENVVTITAYQRRGIGRAVMEATLKFAWESGVYKIMLMTGKNRKDGGATGFYERLGFTRDHKHAFTIRNVPPRD